MLWVPVAQADTSDKLGPLIPYFIDKFPDTILIILLGTKKGEIRLGPFFINTS